MGAKIRAIRERSNLSQEDFAASIEVSLRAYANYERGEREVPASVLAALSRVYGVDPVWVLVGDEGAPKQIAERTFDRYLFERSGLAVNQAAEEAGIELSTEERVKSFSMVYEISSSDAVVNPSTASVVVRYLSSPQG